MPFVVLGILVLVGVWYILSQAKGNGAIIASGTVEAIQVRISPELGGRVAEVLVQEGDTVQTGDVLLRLDSTLLEAQQSQAEAALALAEANLALLQANPTEQQLAIAQAGLDQAQAVKDAAQRTVDDLPAGYEDTNTGRAAQLQLDQATAALTIAQAQYDTVAAGARQEQLDAAEAQVAAAQAALEIVQVQISHLTLTAPADGVILSRAIQPGEFVAPGATLMILGELDTLTVTVFVPEDRYGVITLGASYPVSIDSFPNEVFTAVVTRIADQAEFTPRNVQTAESRSSTVYAIELQFEPLDARLRPGMPADVNFSAQP